MRFAAFAIAQIVTPHLLRGPALKYGMQQMNVAWRAKVKIILLSCSLKIGCGGVFKRTRFLQKPPQIKRP